MGGSSSKRKKQTSGPTSTADSTAFENSTTSRSVLVNSPNKENRSKNKKGKKNSVKIAKEPKKRKTDKAPNRPRSGSPSVGEPMYFVEPEPSSPVYRKKSSCPSCEAKEELQDCHRERSGSEKSLRFSDFNKIQRKTRVYDWELAPVDIPLYGVAEPTPDETCYVCGVFTGRLVRTCRVCNRAFHDGCLAKIGHGLTDAARALLNSNLWSCHQCVSLNHLLTQFELKSVMQTFEQLGLSTDSVTESEYLSYCQASLQQMGREFPEEMQERCSLRFREVDKTETGTITWTQLLNLESVRILQHRCKDSLVRLLTQPEIAEARRLFKKLDPEKTGFTTKRKVCVLVESLKSKVGGYYPDESLMYEDENLDNAVSWGEFLRDRVVHILAQRPNLRPLGSEDDDLIEDGAMTPSFESIDEEHLGAGGNMAAGHGGVESRKVSRQASSIDQLSSLDISTSILEDLTSELDKRCSQNGEEARAALKEEEEEEEEVSTCPEPSCPETVSSPQMPDGSGSDPAPTRDTSSFEGDLCSGGNEDKSANSVAVSTAARVEEKPFPRRRSGLTTVTDGLRKSEIIFHRNPLDLDDASKAGRQKRCRSVQIGPAYGSLVGKMQTAEWNC